MVLDLVRIDVVLIGVGIMSVMLGVLLCWFELNWLIILIEWLDVVVVESSGFWNNVGIGYFVLCEMNYILEMLDGLIDIIKVVCVNE